jgi:hypothetical protein
MFAVPVSEAGQTVRGACHERVTCTLTSRCATTGCTATGGVAAASGRAWPDPTVFTAVTTPATHTSVVTAATIARRLEDRREDWLEEPEPGERRNPIMANLCKVA